MEPTIQVPQSTKLTSVKAFNPETTIIIENFQRYATEQVESLLSTFGNLDVFDVISEDDVASSIALAQYYSKSSAMKALLALSGCTVRGCSLKAQLIWNSSYYSLTVFSTCCNRAAFLEKRAIWIIILMTSITSGSICQKCLKYGKIEDIKFDFYMGITMVCVTYESPVSAAVAAYCLNNGVTTCSALLVGHSFKRRHYFDTQSTSSSPFQCAFATSRDIIVQWPGSIRPQNRFHFPLSSYDIMCLQSRLQEYSRLVPVFNVNRPKLVPTHCFRPRPPEYCIEIITFKLKKVIIIFEVLLFDGNDAFRVQDISEAVYGKCREAYLYRFTIDFILYNPKFLDEFKPNYSQARWGALLVLDLLISKAWGQKGPPKMDMRIQEVNHFFDQVEPLILESSQCPFMFAKPVHHTLTCFTTSKVASDIKTHRNRISMISFKELPFVRLVGSVDNLNDHKLAVRIISKRQNTVEEESTSSS